MEQTIIRLPAPAEPAPRITQAERIRRRKIARARLTIRGAILGLAVGVIATALIMGTNGTNAAYTADTVAAASAEPQKVAPQTTSADTQNFIEAQDSITTTNLIYVTEQKPKIELPEAEVEMLAKLIWGEARGIESITERAAIVWCVLNRVDAKGYACGHDIEYVVTFPNQFSGYDADYPATTENKNIVADVLMRWIAEKSGAEDVGRILPKEYIYFTGDGQHNHFTDEWKGGNTWDWSLPTPYPN